MKITANCFRNLFSSDSIGQCRLSNAYDAMAVSICESVAISFEKIKIIFLINPENLILIKRLIYLRAKGFIAKNSTYCLYDAIQTVQNGKTYLQPEVGLELVQFLEKEKLKTPQLTDREYQALVMLAKGKTTEEVAELLHLSVRTIFNIKSTALKKLQIQDITQFHQIFFDEEYNS